MITLKEGLRSVSVDAETGERFADMRCRRDANQGRYIHVLVDVHDVDRFVAAGRSA